MVPPERHSSLRAALATRRARWSRALSSLRARGRHELQELALGARRAAGCFAFSSAWVGAWLLGVWAFGSFRVYADAPADVGARLGAAAAAPRPDTGAGTGTTETTPGERSAEQALAAGEAPTEIERVAGLDAEPLVPRVTHPYALDGRSRTAAPGPLACPRVELADHAGDGIAFDPAARVAPPFRERLRELERVVREVSLPFYGRAPSALIVASSYDCRSISGRRERMSEHALGNAIDITGFRFDALDAASAPGFEVRVDRHWKARGDATRELHARFLEALTRALIARDVFRTLLGPAHRDHEDHFHFDMAPHYYVDL